MMQPQSARVECAQSLRKHPRQILPQAPRFYFQAGRAVLGRRPLPVEARLSTSVVQLLSNDSPSVTIPPKCHVVNVSYAGEDGGIVCGLALGGPDSRATHFVSITHLIFERKLPLFRQNDAYQRHRVKKIKQHDRQLLEAAQW